MKKGIKLCRRLSTISLYLYLSPLGDGYGAGVVPRFIGRCAAPATSLLGGVLPATSGR